MELWKKMNLQYDEHPNIKKNIAKPKFFEEMIVLSKELSKDFPFVRVDFYEINGKVYVGEMTFTPGGAFGVYKPHAFDEKMGEWLNLNKLNPEYLLYDVVQSDKHKLFIDKQMVDQS